MDQELYEWLHLLGRWLHITVAIAWIGASFFFMWLDRSFEVNPLANPLAKREGHVGELWMVHGGGFYNVEKLLLGPTKVPEHLHWFKWESYWTWMSGVFLLLLIFYTGGGSFLLDSSVSGVTFWQAVLISICSIVVSWVFYDFLWERELTKNKPIIGHTLTLLWLGGMAYFLCHTLSGRAAYIHIGAMLGTWMTANVFLRIIPRQLKMVEAAKRGEPVNQDWGKNAKNRSTHNTYFTLPVIFIMLSNHFPMTYGHTWNWLIVLLMSAAGAAIRHYFVIRLQDPPRAKAFASAGVAIILGVIIFSRQPSSSAEPPKLPIETVAPAAVAGFDITGVVKFEGNAPKGKKLLLPMGCTSGPQHDVFSNEVIVTDGKLKNVIVRVIKGLEGKSFTDVPSTPVVVDQRDCIYAPRSIAARVGQKVEFLNSDSVFHNVRALTKANEEFNIAMPNKNDKLTRVFSKPEILQTKCSIHPWMNANIAVVDHPYFAVSGDHGEFVIKSLPPGSYTIEVWHEVFGTQEKKISVKENSNIEFTYKK